MIGRMLELAMILRRRRFKRGALELNMPEVEIDLGEEGEVVGAHLASHDVSHQIIEEFMLAANEAVASHLTEAKVGFLRRGHADPEPRKLKEFAEFARSLGIEIEDPQSRFELQTVLAETADKPEAYAVHFGLLRSLKQAVYTPEPEGHYALASEDYCHFTSPIRRYPDLQVHRQLTALLAGKRPKSDFDELAALAEHCTRTERRAETAERELIKIKLLTYLAEHIGETFHAVIVGGRGLRLLLPARRVPGRGPGPHHQPGRRLLLPRGGDAHPDRPAGGQSLPPGRPDRGDGRPGRHRPPRARPDPRRLAAARTSPPPRPRPPRRAADGPPLGPGPTGPRSPPTKAKERGEAADGRSEREARPGRDRAARRADRSAVDGASARDLGRPRGAGRRSARPSSRARLDPIPATASGQVARNCSG